MNIEALISKAAGEAVKALYGMEASEKMLQLQKTRSEFEGNLTLVVFPFVKAAKKSPEQTAQEIGEYLVNNCSAVEKFNVVKGFLYCNRSPKHSLISSNIQVFLIRSSFSKTRQNPEKLPHSPRLDLRT